MSILHGHGPAAALLLALLLDPDRLDRKITPLSPATVTIPPSGSLGLAITTART